MQISLSMANEFGVNDELVFQNYLVLDTIPNYHNSHLNK